MFKNLIIFRLSDMWSANLVAIEKALQENKFTPVASNQMQSMGWIEPRGEDFAPLAENVSGHWIMRFCTEKKIIPGSVVKRMVEERAKKIEETSGVKPGKKALRDMKEDVIHELMPHAFTKIDSTSIWINPAEKMMVVDAGSIGKCDTVITELVKCLEGFGVTLLNTQNSPAACMSQWLLESEAPDPFTINRECELQSADEEKARVKYDRHNLDIEEVKRHIAQGKVPTKLSMTWSGRASFTLTNAFQVKKLTFLDVVTDDAGEGGFDADVAILTGELSKLIPDLVDALGGELKG